MKEDILQAKRRLLQSTFNNSGNSDIFGTIMTCSPKYSNCQLCKYINEPQNSDVCTYCAKHNKSTEYYR